MMRGKHIFRRINKKKYKHWSELRNKNNQHGAFSPSNESIESALNFANIFYISLLKAGMPRVFLVFLVYTENKKFNCGKLRTLLTFC